MPEVFKALASLRPGAIQQLMLAKQQQQQQHPSNEPELLQRLHACLDGAAIQQALGQHTQQQITQQQSTMRQLAAYHQVFELLLASLTTYRCVHGGCVKLAAGVGNRCCSALSVGAPRGT